MVKRNDLSDLSDKGQIAMARVRASPKQQAPGMQWLV